MADKLTEEQRALIPVVRDEWIKLALGGDSSLDEEACWKGLRFLYDAAKLEHPKKLEVVGSPKALRDATGLYDAVYYAGLGHDAGWTSYYDFLTRIGLIDYPAFNSWVEYLKSGVWDAVYLQERVVVCRRPTSVKRNEKSRLHCADGPAVTWVDGNKNYFWNGVRMKAEHIENPDRITKDDILKTGNVEVRRSIIECMGKERFVTVMDPNVIDTDEDYAGMPRRLMRVEVANDEAVVYCEVKCPSTGKLHYIRTHPDTKRCSEAIALSFGMKVGDYRPLIER